MSSLQGGRVLLACLIAFALLPGCRGEGGEEADNDGAKVSKSLEEGSTPDAIDATLAEGMAIPQEELAKSPRAVRISGTLSVEGYTQGLLQIDVLPDKRGPQRPVTTARFKAPGPYEMYVPSGMGALTLNGILDIDSDGPTMTDPTGAYAKGSITPEGEALTNLDITIDIANIQAPPPRDQPAQPKDPNDPNTKAAGDDDLNIDDSEDSEIILKASGD